VARAFNACKAEVFNRGRPPDSFLQELIDWATIAPDVIFEENDRVDIYSAVVRDLGPWKDKLHRKAVMLEVLRVLGGFESSWSWTAGVDSTNPKSNTPCTAEAGIFQCSGDSMAFSPELKDFVLGLASDGGCDTFAEVTKNVHKFAIEYCARLLRYTINHHGPIRDGHVNAWLRRDAVQEFQDFITDTVTT
jgi:hypothetical protein